MSQKIKIMILGDVRENGKNVYIVQVEDEIFIMDAGLKYPDSSLPGINVVIPNLDFFCDYDDKIAGTFLTHGHADLINALPHISRNYDVPVSGSKLTTELAKIAAQCENRHRKNDLFHVTDADIKVEFKNANVSLFKTTHLIPDSLGIDISTKEGEIVYTGDFKFDPSAKEGFRIDFVHLSEIAQEGVLALSSDSANAEVNFPNDRQISIEKYILNIFENYEGRIIVAAKASNIIRVQEISQAAATGRHVLLTGRDAGKIVYTAMKLGYLNVPKGLLVHSKDLKKIPGKELVILGTGRMGEPPKSLQKMATNRYHMIKIKKGDLVFIATTPSHSAEAMVTQTNDTIYRAGGIVKELGRDKYTSGHTTDRDLQLLIDTPKPKFLIPVIGEYHLLETHKDLAIEAGMNKKDIFLSHNGDAYVLERGRFYRTDAAPGEDIMIDGSGVGDVGNIVLRDHEVLSNDGVSIATVTVDRKKKKIISEPRVLIRGFVYTKANHALMNGAPGVTKEAVNNSFEHKKSDWTELRQNVRNDVEKYLYKQMGRRPVVLLVVMEANQNRHRAMARRNNQENNSEKRQNRRNYYKEDPEQEKAKA